MSMKTRYFSQDSVPLSFLPFHCQHFLMSSETISHNWLVLHCGHIDTGNLVIEFPENKKSPWLLLRISK